MRHSSLLVTSHSVHLAMAFQQENVSLSQKPTPSSTVNALHSQTHVSVERHYCVPMLILLLRAPPSSVFYTFPPHYLQHSLFLTAFSTCSCILLSLLSPSVLVSSCLTVLLFLPVSFLLSFLPLSRSVLEKAVTLPVSAAERISRSLSLPHSVAHMHAHSVTHTYTHIHTFRRPWQHTEAPLQVSFLYLP